MLEFFYIVLGKYVILLKWFKNISYILRLFLILIDNFMWWCGLKIFLNVLYIFWIKVLLDLIVFEKKFSILINDCIFCNLIFFLFKKFLIRFLRIFIFVFGILIIIFNVFILKFRNINLVVGFEVLLWVSGIFIFLVKWLKVDISIVYFWFLYFFVKMKLFK